MNLRKDHYRVLARRPKAAMRTNCETTSVRTASGTAADLNSLRSRAGKSRTALHTKLSSVSGYLFRPVSGRDERQTLSSRRGRCLRDRGVRLCGEGLKNRCLSPVSVAPSARCCFSVSFSRITLQSIYRVDVLACLRRVVVKCL